MLPYLGEESPYDFVRGLTQYVRNIGTDSEEITENLFMEALVSACLYKKSIFDKVGLFDETMRQGEVFDWNIRLVECGCREKRINESTLLYRRHEGNLTNDKNVVAQGQMDAFRKKIARAKNKTIL